MNFDVVTLFPPMLESFIESGLIAQAIRNEKIAIRAFSPREFAVDKHGSVDDSPYGGGSGMVMRVPPIVDTLEWLDACDVPGEKRARRILMTPQGKPFKQADARRLATEERSLRLICGRYEGFDERVRDFVDEEISLGDFVLMGGEVSALAVIEAVARLIPGVLGKIESTYEESHSEALLEYPQYTRPPNYRGREVPAVLMSGDHLKTSKWRRIEAFARTRERRPDLFATVTPTQDEMRALQKRDAERGGR